ncbi:hypothetical protein GCM10009634_75400 [Saccharothrix xinjiangensis]
MSTPDTTGSNDSARGASSSHLPNPIRRAIEITPAAGTGERIIDITTLGRRTGRAHRIEIFSYRAAGATYLCSGAGGAATDWHANLLANPRFTFHAAGTGRGRGVGLRRPAEDGGVVARLPRSGGPVNGRHPMTDEVGACPFLSTAGRGPRAIRRHCATTRGGRREHRKAWRATCRAPRREPSSPWR